MPLLPPVMTATFPSSFFAMRGSSFAGVARGRMIRMLEALGSRRLGGPVAGKGFAAARPPLMGAPRSEHALLGERAVDLDLRWALGQSFLLAALAVAGQVGRLAMHVEGGVVLVHLVEDEEIGILCRAMRAIDETARLRLSDDPRLLGEQRGRASPLPFAARIFATTVSTFAIEASPFVTA